MIYINSNSTINIDYKKENDMGYGVKIQEVKRANSRSFYVNFPVAFADAVNLGKGEEMEWVIEDRNTFVLKRKKASKSFIKKK